MEYLLVSDHWSSLLRHIKDETGQRYKTENLANDILRYIRYHRFRQYNLFIQRRGEEYEKLMEDLLKNYEKELVDKLVLDDQFWNLTIEFGGL
jgi:hypothetical protein